MFSAPHRIVLVSFFLLGLVNNFTFVIFITAAEHLLTNYAGFILVCTVIPGFVTRLLLSPFIHNIPFAPRIIIVSLTSFICTIVVAVSPGTVPKLAALIIQAAIGALGEISFLALTASFDDAVVGMWASGTGAAGVVGAGVYVFLTNVLSWTSERTLAVCSVFPLAMILIYWRGLRGREGFQRIPQSSKSTSEGDNGTPEENTQEKNSVSGMFRPSDNATTDEEAHETQSVNADSALTKREYLSRLLTVYMLPLSVVYFAEYTINQGVLGTLNKFRDGRSHDQERTYSGLQLAYQIAVFVSRSSIAVFKIHALWILPVLQMLNLAALTLSSIYLWLPNLVTAYAIVTWEGLLGGLTYVNAFYRLRRESPKHLREWALGTATVGDAAGISLAAIVSVWLETAILRYRGQT